MHATTASIIARRGCCTISSPFHTRTITAIATVTTPQLYLPAQPQQKRHFGGLFLVNENNHYLRSNSIRREFSSTTTTTTTDITAAAEGDENDDNAAAEGGTYAVIDHSEAYEMAMEGRHGQQLALARLEGIGKDNLPFDPFLEEEEQLLEEEERQQQQLLEADGGEEGDIKNNNSMKDTDHDDEYDDEYDEDDDFDDEEEDDDDDDDEEDENNNSIYNRDGSLRRKKSTLATLRAGYPAGGLFAVLEIVGSQHKVTTDDLLVVHRLQPVDQYKIGSVHTFGGEGGDNSKNVLLVGSSHLTIAGMPYVPGAEVDVMVEEITQDAKVIIFKKRRRKHSQRKNGFRRDLTLLRILDIRLPEQYKDHKYVGRDSVDEIDHNELEDADNSPNTTVISPSSENTVKFDNNEKEDVGQLKLAKQ